MKGWIAIAQRSETGIDKFDPARGYVITEAAPRRQQIAANDLFFLHDNDRVVAVARVTRVTCDQTRRTVLRCPECGISQMNARTKHATNFRCLYNHEFAAPVAVQEDEAVQTAFFGDDYVPVAAEIKAADLRPFEITNSQALVLRPCDLEGAAQYVVRRDFRAGKSLTAWMSDGTHDLTDIDADDRPAVDVLGCKGKVQMGIRIRRGDSLFRNRLLKRYGERCMISGCDVLALVEAAYIQPQPGVKSNNPTNGVLLRSDLHTLFDVNLIGINPDDHTVAIHPKLLNTDYAQFAGLPLNFEGAKRPNQRAMLARWENFLASVGGTYPQWAARPVEVAPVVLKPHETVAAEPQRWRSARVGT